MSPPPLFSVVICTYQRYDRLPQAIQSVLRQDIGAEHFDLWVMDNSPASPERTALQKHYATTSGLHYVTLDFPGLANARNEALARCKGNIVVFLDDDAVALPGWLSAYREAFEGADATIAAIGGRIIPVFESAKPVWLHDNLMHYLSVCDRDEMPQGYAPCGANVAFRREALDGAIFHTGLGRRGGENNNLLSGEDSSLTAHILNNGGKFGYAPKAAVDHHIPAHRLTRSWFRRRVAWQAISDQLQNGLKAEDAPQLWPHIMTYLRKVPREHMPFMGLFWDTDDEGLFLQQLICTQLLTHIMISQGSYPPGMAD